MSENLGRLRNMIDALPARMSQVVHAWAERTPEACALLETEQRLTYRELSEAVHSAAAWLRAQHVRPGDRVMIVGENSIALAVFVLALGEMDAWPLVVNARVSAQEIDVIFAHSDARLQLFTTQSSPDAACHAQRLGARLIDLAWCGQIGMTQARPEAVAEPVFQDGARQVGALIYTSGTTGQPKGVMLSHRSILFTAAVGGVMRRFEPSDHVYGVLPMSHIVGFSSVLMGTLLFGACLELVPRFDPQLALAALTSGRITRFQGVPTMYQRMLEVAGGRPHCPALKTIGVAGAPLEVALKNAVEDMFGLPLLNGYGITECAPTIAFARVDDPRPDETVGPPIPMIEIRLVGRERREVAAGEVGELHVRGPNVMLGYYRAHDLTAQVIDGQGWFNTGDLARLDGPYLYIVGRTKELIIRSGFNVYPPEIEGVLATHPCVASCAVVGRKVPGNEEVVAFVQLRPGAQATPEEIMAFMAERVAPYKRPAQVYLRAQLPVTSAGKILKHKLAQEAADAALDS